MADPHNPDRYGETWPQHKLDACMVGLRLMKPLVTFSGGWAWHFLSPEGHVEYKHAHDHKDVDIHVPKENVGEALGVILSLGYKKVPTVYDKHQSKEEFRRYERVVEGMTCSVCEGRGNIRPSNPLGAREPECCPTCKGTGVAPPFRLTIDFFVGDYPTMTVGEEEWTVVRPDVLLSFYNTIHGSNKAWAVRSAAKLIDVGEKPENIAGRYLLITSPDLDVYFCTKCGWQGQFPKKIGNLHGCCDNCNYMATNQGKPDYMTLEQAQEHMKLAIEGFSSPVSRQKGYQRHTK